MYYGLVHFPDLQNTNLNRIRKKYDPWFGKISEHITFIFPVPCSVGLNNISTHIETKLKGVNSIECHFYGFKKSWDHFLLWVPGEGGEKIIELHDKFYTGILEPYYRADIPYEPHIALGLFVKGKYNPEDPKALELNEELYRQALSEAMSYDLNVSIKIDKFTLLEFDSAFTEFRAVKEFFL